MSNIQKRFMPITMGEKRTLVGEGMVYGDVGTRPWSGGSKEIFSPNAFGDVGGDDVILNVMHDRNRPIARTGGGGLEVASDSVSLRVSAEMPDTVDGNDALEMVRKNILRGFSVEFEPTDERSEIRDGVTYYIIEKAELLGVGLVDKPAFPKAKVNSIRQEEMEMSDEDKVNIEKLLEDKINEVVEKIKTEQRRESPDSVINTDQLRDALSETVAESAEAIAKEQVEKALKEKEEADENARKAEEERASSEQAAKDREEEVIEAAERRAELITQVRALLPEDYEVKGKTKKDILIAAAGEEIKDAEKRSEDYLEAKVEGILERRLAAGQPPATGETSRPVAQGINLNSIVEFRRREQSLARMGVK